MDVTATTPPQVDDYVARHTTMHDDVLASIERETVRDRDDAQMLSGHVVGTLLATLAAVSGARRVLEVGTFTGYSALSIAQVLPSDGQVITCEVDPGTAQLAQANLDLHPAGSKVEIAVGPALETLSALAGPFDMVFLDAAKHQYPDYLDLVLPMLAPRGMIVADNTLWSGRVVDATPDHEDADTAGLVRFNTRVATDPALRAVLLPVRDGVTVVTRVD